MRIAICDDEKTQAQANEKLINYWAKKNLVNVTIDIFASAEEFLFRWSEGHPYNLAVFDIKMKRMTGIELAKTIRKTDNDLQIIFITGIAEYVFEGYEVSALNYLIKPFAPEAFVKTLDKAYAAYKLKEQSSLMVSQVDRLIRIPFPEILYLEIHGHYFDIHTHNMETFKTKKQMKEMLSVLDKSLFIQCHRSYIVNISYVSSLSRQEVTLKTGFSIPMSPPNVQPVTQLFVEYHYKHIISQT